MILGFNSLQAESGSKAELIFVVNPECFRFNSLQAGKRIQSFLCSFSTPPLEMLFQFPSSGKADPKIPSSEDKDGAVKFQFPSSGKADPKKRFAM